MTFLKTELSLVMDVYIRVLGKGISYHHIGGVQDCLGYSNQSSPRGLSFSCVYLQFAVRLVCFVAWLLKGNCTFME